MPDIVLATLNAKYIHAAFGLRYLMANLGKLRSRAVMREFDINQRPLDIVERLVSEGPRIVGLGVYIWNARQTLEVVSLLKRIRPDACVVLGGPEVSFETNRQELVQQADYVITGEADLEFANLCGEILSGRPPAEKVRAAALPRFDQLQLPYDLYDEQDIAHRVLYVEASRGCPFTCEFCLSSLDIPVRQVDLDSFLDAIGQLMERGATQFKFVDRTFNLNLKVSSAILEFLIERYRPGHFYHFEMVPDRLPGGLREIIGRFPPGALQFEVGIQTFNPDVAANISRRQNYERLAENIRFLRTETGVHIHADLIVGLPGESLDSFGAGFDRLIELGPQEIQVGMLKRLRGTPIVRHDREWQMTYSEMPPYEVLQTRTISFTDMQRMRRFARYWDLVGNSGNFIATTPLIWHGKASAFRSFLEFADWLHASTGRTHGIALKKLMELLFDYLVGQRGLDPTETAPVLLEDYQRGGRSDVPIFLRKWIDEKGVAAKRFETGVLKRQGRHWARESSEVT